MCVLVCLCKDAELNSRDDQSEKKDLWSKSTETNNSARQALRYRCLGLWSLYWMVRNRIPRGSPDCLITAE